jgi:hypothetical protein
MSSWARGCLAAPGERPCIAVSWQTSRPGVLLADRWRPTTQALKGTSVRWSASCSGEEPVATYCEEPDSGRGSVVSNWMERSVSVWASVMASPGTAGSGFGIHAARLISHSLTSRPPKRHALRQHPRVRRISSSVAAFTSPHQTARAVWGYLHSWRPLAGP